MTKKNKNITQKQNKKIEYLSINNKKISLRTVFAIVVVSVSLLLYIRTIGFSLVQCDDDVMVLNEKEFNSKISNIPKSFERTFFVNDIFYRPILNISFIIDSQIGGTNIKMYRFTNILIHSLSSLLVFLLLLRLGFTDRHSFVASLFFAVHPILTPAVSWLSGRNDALLTLFTLISFINFISYIESKSSIRWLFLSLHLFTFFLSMFTKESAIIIPIAILVYLVLIKKDKNYVKSYLYPAIGWIAIILIWYIMRDNVIKNAIGEGVLQTSPIDAFFKNLPTLLVLPGKVLLPIRMSPLANYELIGFITGIIAIILIVLSYFLLKKSDKKMIIFGFLWYLLFIAPTLIARIQDFDFEYAEHRIYLPLIGFIIILTEVFRAFNLDFKNKKIIAVSAILLLLFSVDSFAYQNKFRNPYKFWGHFINTYPKTTRGFIGLGKVYFSLDSINKVEALMLRGMKVKPDFKYWYTNLSTIELRRKNMQKTAEYAYKALQLDPNDEMANFNMGITLAANNRVNESVPYFEKAAFIGKRPLWYAYLGDAYAQSNMTNDAIESYKHALGLDPTLEKAYVSYSNLFLKLNNADQAIAVYLSIMQANQNNPGFYLNFGTLYADMSMFNEAETMWRKALSINPNIIEAYNNLLRLAMMQKDNSKIKLYGSELTRRGINLPPEVLQVINN